MPFFSIVIPCYNAEQTLAMTLESVRNQSFTDFEVILVDDGSHDRTSHIAKNISLEDERFHFIKLENGGPSRARNIGACHYAKGRYVAFLDSDDQWTADKLEQCHARLTAPNPPDGLYSQIAFFRETPADARTVSKVLAEPLSVFELLKENAVCTMSNLLVCRHTLKRSGGFDPNIVHGEDLEWLIRLVSCGARIEAIHKCLTYYRTNMDGLSADLNAMQTGWENALHSALCCGAKLSASERLIAETIHLRYLARRALRVQVPRGTALRFALMALQKSPTAFFAQPIRGALTLMGAAIEPFLPNALRHAAFVN